MGKTIPPSLEKNWQQIIQGGLSVSFRKGQTIFYEGHKPSGIFVLLSGEVELSEEKTPDQRHHRWRSPQGIVFGLSAIIEQRSFCCTGTAKSDSEVIFVPKTILLPFLEAGSNI